MAKIAVHFGAGNIGRGFVAQSLHASGYEVVFADVSDELIGALQRQQSYEVREVGEGATTHVVEGYRAINSATHETELVEELSRAALITTAVGARMLTFVAPVLAKGLQARHPDAPRATVIACENAIGGTDMLAEEVRKHASADNAVFANCAIDRIVPDQPAGSLDVTIESFSEWVVDRTPFDGQEPEISGVTWVDDLTPFIERKLFTVNTGHAASAYHGIQQGYETIREALSSPGLEAEVRAVLDETKRLLVEKHRFSEEEQQAYIDTTLTRITDPNLRDTCERVGRGPLRKLSRSERFVGPAAQLAERGHTAEHLLAAIGAALRFDVPEDEESVQLQRMLSSGRAADDLAAEITGLGPGDAVFASVVDVFERRLDR